MKYSLSDTIAALATPPGNAALAIVRLSGKAALSITATHFSHPDKLLKAKGFTAVHGWFAAAGEILDEVVCLVFRSPHSFTGEDMVEITCHGNPDIANRILKAVLAGCRLAEPGEFTLRAFMNQRLDLVQAEAVNDLIQAQTPKAETAALQQLQGNLSQQVQELIDTVQMCRMQFELAIDFADQDLPELDLLPLRQILEETRLRLDTLLKNGKQGRLLREGFRVVLAGPPNVGKSSLFNRLLEESRAIVTSQPGTTRDYLDEWLNLDGYPVHLYDTAGLRETLDRVEKIGVERTHSLLQTADLQVFITEPGLLPANVYTMPDPSHFIDAAQSETAQNVLFVLNKVDVLGCRTLADYITYCNADMSAPSQFGTNANALPDNYIPCSARLPDGLDMLRQTIQARINQSGPSDQSILVTNTRHLAALEQALSALNHALEAIENQAGYEFIAFDLLQSVNKLGEITGTIFTDDLLDSIFSQFCIGK